TVLRHVVKDDAEFFGKGRGVELEVALGAGARAGAVDADQGMAAAELLIVQPHALDRHEFAVSGLRIHRQFSCDIIHPAQALRTQRTPARLRVRASTME